MKVKFVRQEDRRGCVIACLAMVLGKTYAEVVKDFYHDFTEEGFDLERACMYLADNGAQIIEKRRLWYNRKDFSRAEILKPFAPVHIVSVQQFFDSESSHAVVMDENGVIFCPDGATHLEILDSYDIDICYGVYPPGLEGKSKK